MEGKFKYDPRLHHRKSIRLKGFDYSQAGLYFITICCQDRICRFGNIENGKMILNECGEVAFNEWVKLTERFLNFQLDEIQIMPNHIHGIIMLNDFSTVGAGFTPALHPCNTPAPNSICDNPVSDSVCDNPVSDSICDNPVSDSICDNPVSDSICDNPAIMEIGATTQMDIGAIANWATAQMEIGTTTQMDIGAIANWATARVAPTFAADNPNHLNTFQYLDGLQNLDIGATAQMDIRSITQMDIGATARVAPTVGNIIGAYKSLVTNGCLNIYKSNDKKMGKLWQRNYYEHFIRNEKSYYTIANYIINNPANWKNDQFFIK